jgi:hypothetical protein
MREKEIVQIHLDRLHVFISSRMQELEDLRAILHRELENLGIDAFVYEVDQGAPTQMIPSKSRCSKSSEPTV